jgi:two-component system response regulator (stage 0 sporulation protein F)
VSVIKHKILIVDDQPGIRLLLMDVFTNEGYEVILAQNGKEALEKISKHKFDLIMLDYRLPILNGHEVLQQMINEKITIPVIMMSGLIENIKEDFKQEDMMIEIVAKPFNIKDICELVKSMLV